jgi:hypothetical protein
MKMDGSSRRWGSNYLWNVGKFLPDYTALQPRRHPSSNMNNSDTHIFKFRVQESSFVKTSKSIISKSATVSAPYTECSIQLKEQNRLICHFYSLSRPCWYTCKRQFKWRRNVFLPTRYHQCRCIFRITSVWSLAIKYSCIKMYRLINVLSDLRTF